MLPNTATQFSFGETRFPPPYPLFIQNFKILIGSCNEKAPYSHCGNTIPDKLLQLSNSPFKNEFYRNISFHNEEPRNDCFYAAYKLNKPIKYTLSEQFSSFKNLL